jgi:hypothetical protein
MTIVNTLDDKQVRVEEAYDLNEIKNALESSLYVPDIQVRPVIIKVLLSYLKEKLSDPAYKVMPLIGYTNGDISGMVICQIHPHYTSYSRKCGTFGWLTADSFAVCEQLMRAVEVFTKKHNLRKLRGPINFPKSLGGIGLQVMGFQEQMLYGVAYTDPRSQLVSYLDQLGYHQESEYTCVYVSQKTWNKGKKIDNDIIFGYLPLKELYNYIDDIGNLANNSLYEILPDSSGIHRIHEFFDAFRQIPQEFYTIKTDFKPKEYSTVPHFVETWETCDLENTEPLAPMAFDRHSDELVGILLGLPDLYEAWAGKTITRCNVDTAMVKREYCGKGIFSALNNLGQLTANLHGINYFEGTTIWSNNSRAIDTIFPHCNPTRKHSVVQKRLK